MQKNKSQYSTERLLLTFDLRDANQKNVYEILRTAGYGKRTPLIVDAILRARTTPVEAAYNIDVETIVRKAAEQAASLAIGLLQERKNQCNGEQPSELHEEKDSDFEIGQTDTVPSTSEEFVSDDILRDAVKLSELFN